MTDHEVTALVIDCAQLVAMQDTTAALSLLGSSDIDHRHLQRIALAVLAFVLSGEGAPERFAELRAQVQELALQHGPDDRQVILSLEVISTAQALAEGDIDRADVIVAGSTLRAIDLAWCAVCLTGQCVRGWLGDDHAAFWPGLRHHYGIGGAA